jgi:hypothetical protein
MKVKNKYEEMKKLKKKSEDKKLGQKLLVT